MKQQKALCKRVFSTLAIPAGVALLLNGACLVAGRSLISNAAGFNNFVIYAAIVMITTIALDINLNSGRFDFSIGSVAVLSSIVSAKLAYAVSGGAGNAALMLAAGIAVGALLGLASGAAYVALRIPPIITSMGVTLVYEGVSYTLTSGKYLNAEVQNASMTAFAGNWVFAASIIAVVLAATIVVFDHTRFGYEYRALRAGQRVAVSTGIREVPNAVACYAICGALMGIVGFLQAARSSTINGTSLSFGSISVMFTAFLPMFVGGYIGRHSNDKLGFFLAALCISMLNSFFATFSNELGASAQSIINALLLVAFLIFLNSGELVASVRARRGKAPKVELA